MSFVRITTGELRAVGRSVRRSVTERGPERETAVQSLKAAAAGVLAWALAGWWWHAPFALLAPWTALFLVQDTVYRSLVSALQQFAVVVLGTLLAALAGIVTGDTLAALALALPATVLLGTYARFGAQGLYAPTAALFVIAYGTYGPTDIVHRLLETALGATVGLSVNALVLPPSTTAGSGGCATSWPPRAPGCSPTPRTGWPRGRRRTSRTTGTTGRAGWATSSPICGRPAAGPTRVSGSTPCAGCGTTRTANRRTHRPPWRTPRGTTSPTGCSP